MVSTNESTTALPEDGQRRVAATPSDDGPTYMVVRFFQDERWTTEIIRTGLTLEEARTHTHDPETSSSTATSPEAVSRTAERGAWFDGYMDESR